MNATTSQTATQGPPANRLVDANKLLEIIFDEASRPSIRWVRDQQKNRTIPFCKIGRRVFFDPQLVKAHLTARATGKMK